MASTPRRVFPILGFLLVATGAGAADPPPVQWTNGPTTASSSGSAETQDTVGELLKRIEQLEKRVVELEGMQPVVPGPHTPASPPPAPSGGQEPRTAGTPEPPSDEPIERPSLDVRGFSAVSFRASDALGDTRSFALGQTDMFVTSRLSRKFDVLVETVFEAGEDNKLSVDLERLLLSYRPSEHFNLGVGRYHTAIGYYNTAYHHGVWFQTATGRPLIFAFEDEGGLLPIHDVGLTATGSIPSGRLGLRYVVEVGSGRASRSPRSEPVQISLDENRGKAINFALLARPEFLVGLEAGLSIYRDRLTPEGSPPVGETILAGYAVYQSFGLEWLSEGLLIRHTPQGSADSFKTWSFYAQLARQFGRFRPYLRYQYLDVPQDQGEPVFGESGHHKGPSAGLRYDPGGFVGLKLQYDRVERTGLDPTNDVTLQAAFAF